MTGVLKTISFAAVTAAAILWQVGARAEDGTNFFGSLHFARESVFRTIQTEAIYTRDETAYIYSDSPQMTASIKGYTEPLNATERVMYTSDNPAVSVDENGTVTSDGAETTAHITLTSGDVSVTRTVYVTKKPTRVTLSQTQLHLYADKPEVIPLTLSCEPEDVNPGDIKWHSGDESIAHIDESGNVIPNGVGTTSVYAEAHNGLLSAKCTVYVGLYDVSVKAVFITNAVDKVRAGSDYALSAYVYPDTVSNKTVRWYTSDGGVALIASDGTLKGIAPGKVKVTAETTNGIKDTCEIEITKSDESFESKLISKSVSERVADLQSKPQFEKYDYTLDEMANVQLAAGAVVFSENERAATLEEIRDALTPSKHASGYGKYQFADLSQTNNVDAATLDRYLNGKGVLEGKGSVFKAAAEKYGISELYLVTHACLESGDGRSTLAKGVDVSGTVVYNLFGIGAYDADAVKYGSEYAYSMGWTDVDSAIDGGARWISENYINNSGARQNTLYKMRWNPDSPGTHQYATDIEWAQSQAKIIKSMFDAFPNAELHYEVPLYSGESEFELN